MNVSLELTIECGALCSIGLWDFALNRLGIRDMFPTLADESVSQKARDATQYCASLRTV
jgi:hypothetical protein